ncbi:MAG: hypothetical protein ACKO3G_02035 [Planctomycetaceae bacterium]
MGRLSGHFRPPTHTRRRGRPAAWAAALAFAMAAAAGPTVPAQEAARLPDPVRSTQTVFGIPFQVAPSKQPDLAAARIILQVSRDMGASWEAAGEAPPTATSITFRASTDGEYWFRLRAVDVKGRQRGGEGPDLRVVVDAAAPRLAARVWRGGDGEVVCRYTAADDSLDLTKLVVEYRTKAEPEWKRVAAEPVLARESPAHLVGEDIWWAGDSVEGLAVRIAVSDAAGHRTVRQFSIEATDPGVDQGALAAEIGVPSLPGQAVAGAVVEDTSGGAAPAPAPPAAPLADAGWPAEPTGDWSGDAPPAPDAAGPRSVLARPVGTGGVGAAPASTPLPPAAVPSLDAAAAAGRGPGGAVRALPSEYRGRPLHILASRRFAWEYEMQVDRPDAGPVRVELWSTTDGGFTWQRAAVDDDTRSPIDVTLPTAGFFGFRLEIVPDAPGAGGGPRSGEMPEGWIGIDDDPPQVEIVAAARVEGDPSNTVLVRWLARDKLLAPASIRLLHSPNPDGPWATIAEGLEGEGELPWIPDRNVPARVFIRVEAADAAGNTGQATTPDAVTIAVPRAVGKLGGVRPIAPGGAP